VTERPATTLKAYDKLHKAVLAIVREDSVCPRPMTVPSAESSGAFLPPSPPAEKAAARQDQAQGRPAFPRQSIVECHFLDNQKRCCDVRVLDQPSQHYQRCRQT
jgi:hypothetical protein